MTAWAVRRVGELIRKLCGRAPASAASAAGTQGERAAATWLRRQRGFKVIVRNWRSPSDRREEIDLVARDGDVLVFVEVKTRRAGALVPGFHAVDARKKRVLRRAIGTYLAHVQPRPMTFRFDIVAVTLGDGTPEVEHFENVPLFSKFFRP